MEPVRCSPGSGRILIGFREEYGGAEGLEMTRELHVRWMLLTLGSDEVCPPDIHNTVYNDTFQPATPAIALEVLMADDDNGDLLDGTPHWEIICAAFAEHGIAPGCPCPPCH
jgi:hypothetical protein